ncbi:MAG: efflux RND transporter periplasmic adaptor subunit [Bdellovibrionia bacterium]
MTKKQIFILSSILASVALIVLVFSLINQSRKQYDAVEVKEDSITEAIYGLGTVKSNQVFSFKVGVPKTLEKVHVQEGEKVSKGNLLITFNDNMKVTSPIEGTVLSLPYHAGENVFTEKPMVVIENLEDLYIEARLDQQGSLRVKPGLKVRLSFESFRQKVFTGTLKSLYPNAGEFVARIEVEKLPPQILPGMTSDVAIEVAEKEKAILIPVRAVNSGHVLRERSGKREKIPVQIGISNDEWAELTQGDISLGDKVLIKR